MEINMQRAEASGYFNTVPDWWKHAQNGRAKLESLIQERGMQHILDKTCTAHDTRIATSPPQGHFRHSEESA